LQSLDQEEEGGTGGGCYRYIKCANIDYGYKCANGVWTLASTQYCWIYSYGECGTGSDVPVIGGGTWNIGGGAGGGSISSPAPAPKQIDGVKCFPSWGQKECYCDPCERLKDTRQGIFQNTLSSVNTVLREYSLDVDDLSIKAAGGTISVKRWFYGNQWKWEHTRNNLKFAWDSLGSYIETIDKGGVIYKASSIDVNLYRHDVYRITRTADGYRWEDKRGNWKEYDESGRMNTYGNRRGVVGKLLYEPGEDGNLIGITDRNDKQVIWFEYNTDGLISAAYDIDNRRVEYTYTDGILTTVTDVLGNNTTYDYDTEGRIIKTIDAAGRESHITYDEYNSVASVLDSEGKGHFFEFDYDEGKNEQYARITSSTGRIKEVWYDKDGEIIQVDINGRTIQKIAKDGRNLIITDERGNVTRKEYDEWDNLTKVIYPEGSEISYEYDLRFNRRSKEIDERGIIKEYTYDDTGNMTRKVEAAGTADERITEYTYDSYGNQLTEKRVGDANTVETTTTMAYDASGNMTSITDPEGNITQFTNDNMGNVLTKEDARGKVWTYEYGAMGRLKSITDPLNNVTQLFYDAVGNKIREVDAESKEKAYEYDQRNNLIKSTDDAGNITLIEYNVDGKVTKQIDPGSFTSMTWMAA
jgi:YD repeat-containing protein